MSASQFIKHLLSTSARRLLHPPPPSPSSPLLLFCLSPLSATQPKCSANSSSSSFSSLSSPETTADSSEPSSSSSSSTYLSVRIRCPKDVADTFSEALICFGASSSCMDEEGDSGSSDEISIDSVFLPDKNVDASISSAADSIGLKHVPKYEVAVCEQEDWIKKTQESFHPLEVTKGFWIVPEWIAPKSIQATNIILNPGLAFGTGEHATTRLCLLLLHGFIKGGERILDYGTGSGILAIAALKLGAAFAVGTDVDPQAISSARHNATLNNIGDDRIQLQLVSSDKGTKRDVEGQSSSRHGHVLETEKYDLVIANILLNPLLELADHIVSFAKPGATVAISGILSEQLPYINYAYSSFLEDISVTELDDWACVSGRKKANLTID